MNEITKKDFNYIEKTETKECWWSALQDIDFWAMTSIHFISCLGYTTLDQVLPAGSSSFKVAKIILGSSICAPLVYNIQKLACKIPISTLKNVHHEIIKKIHKLKN